MRQRWSKEQAWNWYQQQGFIFGCNFIVSSAINQVEMWHKDTFDPRAIQKELGLASSIGMNCIRVYLHDSLWREEDMAYIDRIDYFLTICEKFKIRVLLVIFDDCWFEPITGKQPLPSPGVHNSAWARSPGRAILLDKSRWSDLEVYVTALARYFKSDTRIFAWDPYNEVNNIIMGTLHLDDDTRTLAQSSILEHQNVEYEAGQELLSLCVKWLRAENVSQPISAAVYEPRETLNTLLIELSDIVSFHNYLPPEALKQQIQELKTHGRPLICTEYLNRRNACTFESHLPVFIQEHVACFNWGLVDGKTQTKFAWTDPANCQEPEVWFHDVFKSDGSPYREEETAFIKASMLQKSHANETKD